MTIGPQRNNKYGMKFTYQYDEYEPEVSIWLNPESELSTVLENFKGFLQAAGYYIDGDIDIVEKEDEAKKEEV